MIYLVSRIKFGIYQRVELILCVADNTLNDVIDEHLLRHAAGGHDVHGCEGGISAASDAFLHKFMPETIVLSDTRWFRLQRQR